MVVLDAGGYISATRQSTAVFESLKDIFRLGSTRLRKRHVHPMSSFGTASSIVLGTWRAVGVEVRCGGGGRGRVYLRNQTEDSHV